MAAEDSNPKQLNDQVGNWAKAQSNKMRRLVGSMTLKDKVAAYKATRSAAKDSEYKPLEKSIGSSLKKDFGEVTRVNFKFKRKGIFLEHGVGRGRPVRSAKAKPKPWLAPVLNPAIDELADILMEHYADFGAGEIKFQIPGIVTRRIILKNG
jgi:hypothetical protein